MRDFIDIAILNEPSLFIFGILAAIIAAFISGGIAEYRSKFTICIVLIAALSCLIMALNIFSFQKENGQFSFFTSLSFSGLLSAILSLSFSAFAFFKSKDLVLSVVSFVISFVIFILFFLVATYVGPKVVG